jgi:WD40 repeat protein
VRHGVRPLIVRDARGRTISKQPSDHQCAMAFSPRGDRIAFGRDDQVAVHDPPAHTTLTSRSASRSPGKISSIAWAPDGKRIAAVSERRIYLWDVVAGARATSIYVADQVAVAVAPDGTVQPYGDASAARELLACRIGARLYPYAEARLASSLRADPAG